MLKFRKCNVDIMLFSNIQPILQICQLSQKVAFFRKIFFLPIIQELVQDHILHFVVISLLVSFNLESVLLRDINILEECLSVLFPNDFTQILHFWYEYLIGDVMFFSGHHGMRYVMLACSIIHDGKFDHLMRVGVGG